MGGSLSKRRTSRVGEPSIKLTDGMHAAGVTGPNEAQSVPSGLDDFEDALRKQQQRVDEVERALDQERKAKIAALEEELARTRVELDNERQLRTTEANEARMAAAERDEALHNQLADLTDIVQQNQALMSILVDQQTAARQREEEQQQANEGKPGIEQVMEELQRQNSEQKSHLNALSEGWKSDNNRQHQETIDAVRATASEQVPFNVQGYLEEFSRAAATEVRILLSEAGKLRDEHRNTQ